MTSQQQQQQLKINMLNQQNQQTNAQTSMSQNPNSGIPTTSMTQVSQPNQATTSPAQVKIDPDCFYIFIGNLLSRVLLNRRSNLDPVGSATRFGKVCSNG
jgi:hypothetical protein